MAYIDKAKMMQKIETESRMWGEDYGITDVLCDIDDFPTADVVEVVRCKDCKHSCFLAICQFTHQEIYECLKGTKELKGVTDYCSCGERKGV